MPEQLTREELQALAVETRQDIVKLLSQRPHTQSELAKRLGKHVTTVAEHVTKLERSGLIEKRPDGHKWIYFKLSRKGEKLFAPRVYNWAIMLSVSVVAVVLGGSVLGASLFVGGAGAFQESAAIRAPDMATGVEMPPPPAISLVDVMPLVAVGLVMAGLIGLTLALWARRRARAAALTVLAH